jgi:hypothetical protein
VKAVLVFIDGTICDARHRYALRETPDFYSPVQMLRDAAVPGSVEFLRDLARRYSLVYMGARPAATLPQTQEWLARNGFPPGPVYLAPTQEERLAIARALRGRFTFAAGIGDRWDDNELHLEIGCLSIILKEHEGNWETARRHLLPRTASLRSPPIVADCFVCRKHRGEIQIPGGAVYEDDLVYAGHIQILEGKSTAYLGYLMVEPKRHAPTLADIDDTEAAAPARSPLSASGSGPLWRDRCIRCLSVTTYLQPQRDCSFFYGGSGPSSPARCNQS